MSESESESEAIVRLKKLSDRDLTEAIIDCLRPTIMRNATRIKASSLDSNFRTSFRLQIVADLSNPHQMEVEASGCVDPVLFEKLKLKKAW